MAKILLVEDDNNLREIYEARLQAEGYQIITAHDGEEALVVAKNDIPDLIISDVMMPKISGFEMLDILRNTDGLKEVKVIMLTALGQNEDQLRADKLGADRYLVKSQVTLEDIVKAAGELLNDEAAGQALQTSAEVSEPAAQASTTESPESMASTTLPDSPMPEASDQQPDDAVSELPTSPSPEAGNDQATVEDVSDPDSDQMSNDKLMDEAVSSLNSDSTPAETETTADNEESPTDDSSSNEPMVPDLTLPLTDPQNPGSEIPVETISEESKDVEAQIENFANSSVDETAADTSTPPATEEAVTSPSIVSRTDAVTPKEGTEQPSVDSPPVAAATAPEEHDVLTGLSTKKVIVPITPDEVKPDINQLIADEEAKEAQQASAPVTEATTEPPAEQPTAPTTTPTVEPTTKTEVQPSSGNSDINSIAL